MNVIINGIKYVPIPDIPTDKGLLTALDLRFSSDAGDDLTVRDYLRTLLQTLWEEKDSFSGKRPLGNSNWEYELYALLIKAGFISGALDEDGYVDTINQTEANRYVAKMIVAAFHGVETE